jgi:acyl-coenzyme A thioesterase PaaI-like protein
VSGLAFQDLIPGNCCFGCGPGNSRGLRIKSYWSEEGIATCSYLPEPHQTAGPEGLLNGGIIATLIDCHSVCTAVADAYRRAGREIGSDPEIWYVTGTLEIRYLAPVPIDRAVDLEAAIVETGDRKTIVDCHLRSDGLECAHGTVVAVRVPDSWRQAR